MSTNLGTDSMNTKSGKKKNRSSKRASTETPTSQPHLRSRPPPRSFVSTTSLTRDVVHRATLLESMSGHAFEDLKFFAFSRRQDDGLVGTPLPLFVNSNLIHRTTDHFKIIFSAGFAEGLISDLDAPFPSTRPTTTDQYDYFEDSDLEDDDPAESQSTSDSAQKESDDLLEGVAVNVCDTSDVDVKSSRAEGSTVVGDKDMREPPQSKWDFTTTQSSTTSQVTSKPGRVIHVQHIAHKTMKAFVYWAYFDETSFAPLKSQQKPSNASGAVPSCSPKSMYRLAHEYNIEALKKKAADDVKSKLSTENILQELFSHFTSLYDDIRVIEQEFLLANIKDVKVQAQLPVWIKYLQDGELPGNAHDILTSVVVKICSLSSPAPDPLMKKCPRGCAYANYRCNNCSCSF